jgi:ubiquinone/menaquinone biosynthesis C-methylase UbiE
MCDTGGLDHRTIVDLIDEGSRVLDLGCGNGDLIWLLETLKMSARRESSWITTR